MATKLEKMGNALNERYRERTNEAFLAVFGIEIETRWSFLDGNLKSERIDGEPFSVSQALWMAAWSDGYADAMQQVQFEGYGWNEPNVEPHASVGLKNQAAAAVVGLPEAEESDV